MIEIVLGIRKQKELRVILGHPVYVHAISRRRNANILNRRFANHCEPSDTDIYSGRN